MLELRVNGKLALGKDSVAGRRVTTLARWNESLRAYANKNMGIIYKES